MILFQNFFVIFKILYCVFRPEDVSLTNVIEYTQIDNMIMCEVSLAVWSNPGGYKEMSSVLADQ